MTRFESEIMSYEFIHINPLNLKRHPEPALSADRLDSGSNKLILEMLKQVQHDAPSLQSQINISVVRLSGVEALSYEK